MRYLLLSGFLLLAACQSDEQNYTRLKHELDVLALPVSLEARAEARGEPVCPDLVKLPTNQYMKACNEQVQKDQTAYALKKREFDKFMENR